MCPPASPASPASQLSPFFTSPSLLSSVHHLSPPYVSANTGQVAPLICLLLLVVSCPSHPPPLKTAFRAGANGAQIIAICSTPPSPVYQVQHFDAPNQERDVHHITVEYILVAIPRPRLVHEPMQLRLSRLNRFFCVHICDLHDQVEFLAFPCLALLFSHRILYQRCFFSP